MDEWPNGIVHNFSKNNNCHISSSSSATAAATTTTTDLFIVYVLVNVYG